MKIPEIGLGTWLIDNEMVAEVVKNAISVGYRHIDTAQAYENEEGVGRGIKESGIKREELFITSKVRAEYKNYEDAKKSIDESLEKLGLDYIDLMLIHSPQPWHEFRSGKNYDKENISVWEALEEAYKEGKVKAIGVSNFLISDLKNITDNCEIKPMVNQILAHISNTPFGLVDYCQKEGIIVEAYSPIAHGAANNSPTIKAIADKYNVTIAQLCIKYVIQLGMIALPKASSVDHLKNNFDVNFMISDDDMDELKTLKNVIDYGDDKVFPVFSE